MKYAIGNRLNYVQIDSQFSNEFEMFLSEFVGGNNSAKLHRTLSITYQIILRVGNSGGYFMPATDDDICLQSRAFNISVGELKALYDVATRRGVYDREQYIKNHIITNYSFQVSFLAAKEKSESWVMQPEHLLDSVYNHFKFDVQNKRIVDKLDKLVGKINSIEQDQKKIESNNKVIVSNSQEEKQIQTDNQYNDLTVDNDISLEEFKNKYPLNCEKLPSTWVKPKGISLKEIAKAIDKSQFFLAVKKFMSLDRLAGEFYHDVIAGKYDDATYRTNPQISNKKNKQNFSESHQYTDKQINELYDDPQSIILGELS